LVASEIEWIEVYVGLSATPAEFASAGDCAVIAVKTRKIR